MGLSAVVTSFALILIAGACGASVEGKDDKIIGGDIVDISLAPYQLALYRDFWGFGRFVFGCGAVIISPTVGLCAAHCTVSFSLSGLYARAGSNAHASGGSVHFLRRLFNHPSYNRVHLYNDISVLFFSSEIPISLDSSPVTLPPQGYYPPARTPAFVAGWGSIRVGGSAQALLRGVTLPIVSLAECQQLYSDFRIEVREHMLCAGLVGVGGADACSGDSGGPLVVGNTLVGIVSWGDSCALANRPGVYTNVGSYREWISVNAEV